MSSNRALLVVLVALGSIGAAQHIIFPGGRAVGINTNTDVAQSPPEASQLYYGFGADTVDSNTCADDADCITACGGSYTTYTVTNLNNSGAGSFRTAVDGGGDCREVVFDVSGTITITSNISVIDDSYITIAGETSPTGITFDVDGVYALGFFSESENVSDIVIRDVRVIGQDGHPGGSNAEDCITFDSYGVGVSIQDVVVHNVTCDSMADGAIDICHDVSNFTVQFSWIRGDPTAVLVGCSFSSSGASQGSFYRNLWSGNTTRQPRLAGDTTNIEFSNNIMYGWGFDCGSLSGSPPPVCVDGGEGFDIEGHEVGWSSWPGDINVKNNNFHRVVGTEFDGGDRAIVEFDSSGNVGDVYFEGNIVPADENDNVSTGPETTIPAAYQLPLIAASALCQELLVDNPVGAQNTTAAEDTDISTIRTALGC